MIAIYMIIRIKPTYQSTQFYYIKQDSNGHWQRKQLHFHTIDAIIWKKKEMVTGRGNNFISIQSMPLYGKKTETDTGRGNNFISIQSMPLYEKKTETGTSRGNYFISMQSIS